jgi:hypothetical protein
MASVHVIDPLRTHATVNGRPLTHFGVGSPELDGLVRSDRLIAELDRPLTQQAQALLAEVIEEDGATRGLVLRAEACLQAEQVEATAAAEADLARDGAERRTQKEQELRGVDAESNWLTTSVNLACAGIGLGAEFALTYSVLPWCLNIPRGTGLAIAATLAPTCATLVMERALAKLVIEPWERRHQLAPVARGLVWAVMALLQLSLAAVVLQLNWLLAPVRELAAATMREMARGRIPTLDPAPVHDFVRAATLAIALTTPVFFLYGERGLVSLRRRRKLRKELALLRQEQQGQDRLVAQLRAVALSLRAMQPQAEEMADHEARRFRAERQFRLAARLDQLWESQSAQAQVRDMLRHQMHGASKAARPSRPGPPHVVPETRVRLAGTAHAGPA